MMRHMLAALGVTLLLAGGPGAGSAEAQDVFGMLEAHAAMSAQAQYAADLHSSYSNRDDDDDRPFSAPSRPGLTAEEAARLDAEMRERQIEEEARYQRWRNGYWEFFQARDPAGPGEFCTAMFQSPGGMITLSGFDDSWDGALLMFTGERIPKPRALREVTVTLTQTGEPPVTVRAYNRERDPRMGDFGTLVLAVPTMSEALAGMTDEQEFIISINGRQVFRMSWKEGLMAADELRKCVRQR